MDVRKNAASLTAEEWSRFMGAVIALKHTFAPGSELSVYDTFVAIHLGVTRLSGAQNRDGAHGGPGFLPWHREYIRRFEQALQSVDSRVTLPYWNWGLGDLPQTSSLLQDSRLGTMGSGGASNFELETGYLAENPNAFNPMGWEIHPDLRPFGSALQRNPTLNTGPGWPSATTVTNILAETSFHNFRPSLEGVHGTMHIRIGRDMSQMTSPNDPIFFLHHCQVDRIWAMWQRDHPGSANYNPMALAGPGHVLGQPMWPWDAGASASTAGVDDLLPSYPESDVVRPDDVLDHHALGYCYDGEEGCPCGLDGGAEPPTRFRFEDVTLLRGEDLTVVREDVTTLALGEEEPLPTTRALGEEDPGGPTTLALGEEGGPITRVEDGPLTRVEDGGVLGGRNPFGDF